LINLILHEIIFPEKTFCASPLPWRTAKSRKSGGQIFLSGRKDRQECLSS
jgi:hypothetical protein